jgi:Matrixin
MRNLFAKITLAALLAASIGAAPALAGGALEQVDITGNVPSPIAGHVNARLVPIFWDARCIPVQYRVNNTLNPIPNPLGPAFLTLADATAAFQSSLDSWNQIPTSFIEMQIVGTVANPSPRGFDMKNELTFRTPPGFTAIASSPSTSLIADSTFTHGQNIDGDADPDVSSAISVCTDVDGDGDVEFPAGFYKAGTILDNDVQFSTALRYTTNPASADIIANSVDLEGVAVHELGHSLGLSHVVVNNKSTTDGGSPTMFPFIDTSDPAAELQQRTLDSDDIAWASYYYQEGTAASGPAALQPGDVAFGNAYGLITGEVIHGVFNEPVAGASVAAVNRQTGEIVANGLSGTTQLSRSATGGLFLIDPAYNILNGNYVIPVPKGNYDVFVEAMDGNPVPAANVSLTGQIGGLFGQLNFEEEFWNGNNEGAIEKRAGEAKNVHVNEGEVETGIDFITNQTIRIANFGNRNFIGFTLQAGGSHYAVRIPASQISAVLPGQDIYIQAGLFETSLVDASTVPMWAEAMLTTGSVDATTGAATINLASPLEKATGFLAADNDFAPLYFKNPHDLGKAVREGIASGAITDLFLVLRLPQGPFPGVSVTPPVIGLDGGVAVNDVPIFGLSYLSTDGGATFSRVTNFNFRFALELSPAL